MKRRFLFVVISLLILSMSGYLCAEGKKAPDFTLQDLDGSQFTLSSLKGKVVILDFWATWCPPCRAEIPHFISLYSQYKKQGLEIVGVVLDKGGVRDVRPFSEEQGINYLLLIGTQEVAEDYGGIRGIPTTFVIDRDGNIVERYEGYRDKEVFESAIKKLL